VNNIGLPFVASEVNRIRRSIEHGSNYRYRDLCPGRQDLFASRIPIPLAGAPISL
jgi:hypothetical protein